MIHLLRPWFILFFWFFLIVVVFQVLTDKVSTLSIWGSPFWGKYDVIIIIAVLLSAFVLFMIRLRANERKRIEDIQNYATAHGWEFSSEDSLGLKERAEIIYYDRKLSSLSYIRTIKKDDRVIFLFDCLHKHRNASSNVREHRATVCLIESDRFRNLSEPLVISEYLVINETLDGVQVTLEDSPFSNQFVVHSRDANSAKRALNTKIQAILLEYKEKSVYGSITVAIGPSGAVLMIQATIDQNCWEDLIMLARNIESAVS